YEILLKLVQWAGFRDRALFGIADCYTRMGEEEKSLKWLDSLKESFPRYYEKQKVADYQKALEGRRDRKKKPKPADPTDPTRDSRRRHPHQRQRRHWDCLLRAHPGQMAQDQLQYQGPTDGGRQADVFDSPHLRRGRTGRYQRAAGQRPRTRLPGQLHRRTTNA